MKVFVSTTSSQGIANGGRQNDFCFVPDGELVYFGLECGREELDGGCGCRRSLVGVNCHTSTTTFKVIDDPAITKESLATTIAETLISSGFGKADVKLQSRLQAERILSSASAFEVGTVLERRGPSLFVIRRVDRRQVPRVGSRSGTHVVFK